MTRSLLPLVCLCAFGCSQPAFEAGAVDWNRYYDTADSYAILAAYESRYPNLARVFSIRSVTTVPIMRRIVS